MNFTEPLTMPRGSHYGSNYYKVYSAKLKRVATFYSNLEYYNFLSLDINHQVETFCEQPLKIDIIQENQIKHAVFDFWVKYKNGREEFQEIKYSSELIGSDQSSIRSQEQIRRQEQWCSVNKINFIVRTEKDIIQGPYHISSLNHIAARVRRYVPMEKNYYDPMIIKALELAGSMKIRDLIKDKLLPIGNEINHICYLYSHGIIDMDFARRPLDLNTEVYLWQPD